MSAELDAVRSTVARACRVLASQGLADGIYGHVSARVAGGMVLRCRGPRECGLRWTEPADIRLFALDGSPLEELEGWEAPVELPIHGAVLGARAGAGAVVHAHPRSALLCGLAGLDLRPVFGAYNLPALRLALAGVPVFPRSVLISTPALGASLASAMGGSDACLMRGHGITVAGASVEEAVVTAVNLEELCTVTLALAGVGAAPEEVPAEDLAELPDLGPAFIRREWKALAAGV